MNDPRFFTVSYAGPGSIVRLTLNGAGANGTGLWIASPLGAGSSSTRGRSAGCRCSAGRPFEQGFPFTSGDERA